MTGSGTEQDPYILSSWEDLISGTVNVEGVYAEFDDSEGTIDMNSINPDGFGGSLKIKPHVDYKNWTILNMRLVSTGVLEFRGKVNNLKLLNIYCTSTWNNSAVIVFDSFNLRNISISGMFSSQRFIACPGSRSGGVSMKNSTISVHYFGTNNASVVNPRPSDYMPFLSDCHLHLDAVIREDNTNVRYGNVGFKNCLFTGTIDASAVESLGTDSLFYSSSNSVFNITCDKTLKFGSLSNSVYNTDLASYSNTGSSNHAVTSEQMADASYLSSIGFPIGV